jgi:hypothetical protein
MLTAGKMYIQVHIEETNVSRIPLFSIMGTSLLQDVRDFADFDPKKTYYRLSITL